MHESHLADDLVADLLEHARRHGIRRIRTVTVRLGPLSEIQAAVLRHVIEDHARGTPLEGAQLKVEEGTLREVRLVGYEGEP